ncbi:glucose-1-phosphatase-like [Aricia agestis]|uniref:glucose-1-phosphatase-like n=1 Tax=Aricia agestis TaxID=91739 RepID=UPI001C20A3BA|nr:glucose-1-phosphatase-like [Aricia agestis]
MKRESRCCLATVFLLFLIICASVLIYILLANKLHNTYKLQQVLILSRHNARSPTSEVLAKISPHSWPKYEEIPGHLTKKGFLLEGFMGNYFSAWMVQENLIKYGCPSQEDYFVYANSVERTLSSARAFLEKGYPNCNISIHHTDQPDPVFSPYIHNSSSIFKEVALKEMNRMLNELNLNASYLKMQDILNYEQSEFCKVERNCHLTTDSNEVGIAAGKKPILSGPLKISNEAVDAFLMAYYNGFPEDDIGWGKLKTLEDWDSILKLANGYHDVVFNTTHVATDLAMPLLKYMRDIFLNKDYKAILLMGHDANIHVLLKLISIKPFGLLNSYVSTPIGGKIVFQKWLSVESNKYYLKINYIYQSTKQLREGISLSIDNPPLSKLLELNNCATNADGYCPWDKFMKFLKTF